MHICWPPLLRRCDNKPKPGQFTCPPGVLSPLFFVSWGLWIASGIIPGVTIVCRNVSLFPAPVQPPYDVVLRAAAQAYRPPSEQSILEAEELTALKAFRAACEFAGA